MIRSIKMKNCQPFVDAELNDCKMVNFVFGSNGSGTLGGTPSPLNGTHVESTWWSAQTDGTTKPSTHREGSYQRLMRRISLRNSALSRPSAIARPRKGETSTIPKSRLG